MQLVRPWDTISLRIKKISPYPKVPLRMKCIISEFSKGITMLLLQFHNNIMLLNNLLESLWTLLLK
ncbi:hypothetical protein BC2230_80135 [Burkholderia cepacia]